MKTTIFGAGAVGGHLAARLGAGRGGGRGGGARRPARGDPRARHHPPHQATSATTPASAPPTGRKTLGPQDLVIVTVKSSVLPEMAPSIATLVGPDTSVVFAMNGIPWWYLYRAEIDGAAHPICRGSTPTARWRARSATSGSSAA